MSREAPGPVPNRWLHCPRKAADLIMGQFMAFKTPLSTDYDGLVPPECRFPPKMMFDLCKTKKIKFGLWIDLTNTTRFYDSKEVMNENCKYVKLQCRGYGETPSIEQTETFINLAHDFILHHPLQKIAVHCTHGFNRTGFLIVAYLVEKMDMGLEFAIRAFADMRSPGIYKQDYLRELYSRYDDVGDTPPAPSLPGWCFENNESEGEQSGQASSSNSGSSRRGAKTVTFMEGVPGVEHFTEQPKAFYLQKQVQMMCNWKKKGFPGCQPVSMDEDNIKLLHEKPYRVSWKADGLRYMMLIKGREEVYFFDRDHNPFKVSGLTFPRSGDLKRHLEDTLLDGEMVMDKVNGEAIPRYLAYDIVKLEGKDVGRMAFYPSRLLYLENEIIKPRYMAMGCGLINKAAEPFSVRKKDFWAVTQAASLLGEKFASTLSHEPDGLIFQPTNDPYVPGQCPEVLKWKPLHMNSVDFRLKIAKQEGMGIVSQKVCLLYVGQCDQPFGTMKYTKALKDLDNKIVECKFENKQWKFMRERTDKSFPNSFNTAQAVCRSISKPITKEKLLEYIKINRFVDDSEIMPPPRKIKR